MLRALDYLAFQNVCHRDVKPDNILFRHLGEQRYHFQLADFGVANHRNLATTFCGTPYYQAPELYSHSKSLQTPKMDVWSLFATILATHSKFAFPPPAARNYEEILLAILTIAKGLPDLCAMAREDPTQRASAAQMLVAHFNGRGLTTPKAQVPPIRQTLSPDGSQQPATRTQGFMAQQPPLIVYPKPRQRVSQPKLRPGLSPVHAKPAGVIKRRAVPTKEARIRLGREIDVPGSFPDDPV
jgi:serine/threonine protein kinase